MSVNQVIKMPIDAVNVGKGDISAFCGAGISWNSGMPLAGELMEFLLCRLGVDPVDRARLIEREQDGRMVLHIPFEVFMQCIDDHTDIGGLLKIFEKGRAAPNRNHRFIARMASSGLIRTVYTTNFDTLLEDALAAEGVAYDLYYDEDSFATRQEPIPGRVNVFKVHGHIADYKSLRMVMSEIAKQSLSELRSSIIREAFSDGSHTWLLVMGYSFSDIFDIVPVICMIEDNKKKLLLVSHENVPLHVQRLQNENEQQMFRGYDGYRIQGPADSIVESLWKGLEPKIGKLEMQETPAGQTWKPLAETWSGSLEKWQASIVAASLFYETADYDRVVKYCERCLAMAGSDREKVAVCQRFIGLSLSNQGLYINAIPYLEEALAYYRFASLEREVIVELNNLAFCYNGLAKKSPKCLKKALDYASDALKRAEKTDFYHQIEKAHTNLGHARLHQMDYAKALEHYEKAYHLSAQIGDLREAAYACNNKALCCEKLGRKEEALDLYADALYLGRSIKNQQVIARCLNNMGVTYLHMGQLERAADAFESARAEGVWIGNRLEMSQFLGNMITAYCYAKDYSKALEALDMVRSSGYKQITAKAYKELGMAFYKAGDAEQAVSYFRMAIEEATDGAAPEEEIEARTSMGLVLEDRKQYHEALDEYMKAASIAREKSYKQFELVALSGMGFVHRSLGEYEESIECYRHAIELAKELEQHSVMIIEYERLSQIYMLLGLDGDAANCLEQRLRLAIETGNEEATIDSYTSLAIEHYLSRGDNERAYDAMNRAVAIARRMSNKSVLCRALTNLGHVLNMLRQPADAVAPLEEALVIKREIGDEMGLVSTCINLGIACNDTGKYDQALELAREARPIANRRGNRSDEAQCYSIEGIALREKGKIDDAIRAHQTAQEIARGAGNDRIYILEFSNLGIAYFYAGNKEKAIECCSRAEKMAFGKGYLREMMIANHNLMIMKSGKQ